VNSSVKNHARMPSSSFRGGIGIHFVSTWKLQKIGQIGFFTPSRRNVYCSLHNCSCAGQMTDCYGWTTSLQWFASVTVVSLWLTNLTLAQKVAVTSGHAGYALLTFDRPSKTVIVSKHDPRHHRCGAASRHACARGHTAPPCRAACQAGSTPAGRGDAIRIPRCPRLAGFPLEQLTSLGIATSHTSPGRGRPATLWSPVEAEATVQE
jgi:hypothetical protein